MQQLIRNDGGKGEFVESTPPMLGIWDTLMQVGPVGAQWSDLPWGFRRNVETVAGCDAVGWGQECRPHVMRSNKGCSLLILLCGACAWTASDQLVHCKAGPSWGRKCARAARVRTEVPAPAHVAQRRVIMRWPTAAQRQQQTPHDALSSLRPVNSRVVPPTHAGQGGRNLGLHGLGKTAFSTTHVHV